MDKINPYVLVALVVITGGTGGIGAAKLAIDRDYVTISQYNRNADQQERINSHVTDHIEQLKRDTIRCRIVLDMMTGEKDD